MNRVILMGRLTRDPEVRYSQSDSQMAVARYSLAVDRIPSRNAKPDEPTADFINCVAFGNTADFAEKYLHKGTKIAIEGRIRTGKYTNKDGQTVYTTDVVVDRHEFCESRNASGGNFSGAPEAPGAPGASAPSAPADGGFMNVPKGIDEELPFD